MFDDHRPKQGATFRQSSWASARTSNRWDSEMETSLRMHLHADFLSALSWPDLRERLNAKGFYLEQIENRVRLKDVHSDVDICSCRVLGFPSAELTSRFNEMGPASEP